MTITVKSVRVAGQKVLDWAPFIDPQAQDAIKRALQSDREGDKILLPVYAEKQVRWALSHINKTAAQREREVAIEAPKGKFA